MTPDDARDIVLAHGWLAQQPPALQERVLASALLRRAEKGSTLARQADPPGGFYGVVRGYLDIYVGPDPFPLRLGHVASPGWWGAELSALTNTPRRAEIVARTAADFLYVPARALDEIARDEPAFWRCLASVTVEQFDLAVSIAASHGSTDLRARIAVTLLRLMDKSAPEGASYEVPIGHDDLGDIANLSRNTVGRLLADLEKEGCIVRSYGRILVIPNRLKALISLD